MKTWKLIPILVVVGVLAWGGYVLFDQKRSLEEEVSDLQETANQFEEENNAIQERIEYFQEPENLLKEAKSQFNYREPGEKLLILVPKEGEDASTVATSTENE